MGKAFKTALLPTSSATHLDILQGEKYLSLSFLSEALGSKQEM